MPLWAYLGEMQLRMSWNNVLGHYHNPTAQSRTSLMQSLILALIHNKTMIMNLFFP